jgi:hypothetical protein
MLVEKPAPSDVAQPDNRRRSLDELKRHACEYTGGGKTIRTEAR